MKLIAKIENIPVTPAMRRVIVAIYAACVLSLAVVILYAVEAFR